jgi:SAM-dependent methyltransferase
VISFLLHNEAVSEQSERATWESRYAASEPPGGSEPADFLRDNRHQLPERGLACDLGAGDGRNAIFLARHGLEVVAIDFSLGALEKCGALARAHRLAVHCVVADLNGFPLPEGAFDCIINFNFLLRELALRIIAALKPGGVLVFETMTTEHRRFKPAFNPDFLLQPGELIEMFRGLHLIKYRETVLESRNSLRAVASLIARKDECGKENHAAFAGGCPHR